jgi:hypothetical protein
LCFQAKLRLAQNAALFFELLVVDTQLLLLRLQFFRLLLRFRQ